MGSLATTDVCDANAALLRNGELRVLQPVMRSYGQRKSFSGRTVTVQVLDDNVLVREILASKGEGRVLVVDGGGSLRCALLGGILAQRAHTNGWSGVVVNGCIRDVEDINACDIGVRALFAHPVKPNKRGIGVKHVPVHVAGVLICDGEWLSADADGILVSPDQLSA